MPPVSKRRPRRSKVITSRDKVRAHRARLGAQGLRPIQIWVPDTRSPKFAAEARRQCRLIVSSAYAKDDQAFVDAISEFKLP